MYAAYLFSVILGGGLLLLSLLGNVFGGGNLDLEIEGDLDLAVDDLELEGGTDTDHAASKILSIRTLTYSLFGFGATGWLLTTGGAGAAAPTTIAYAAFGGLISGTLVNRAFAWLRRTETGLLEADDTLAGLPGRIVLPLGVESVGSVAIERGGRRRTFRALPHPSAEEKGNLDSWKHVVVVEMKNGVAYVAPSDTDLTALP